MATRKKRERHSWEELSVLHMPNDTFAFRLTDYYDEYVHSHDFYEIVYVLTGEIIHEIDGKKIEMKAGDAFFVAPDVKHRFHRTGECVHRDLLLSNQTFQETCDFIDPSLFNQLSATKFMQFHLPLSKMESFENSLLEYNNYPPSLQRNYSKILACQTVGLLYGKEIKESADTFKGKCLTIISDTLSKPNTLDILRQELGYTDVYFCKKFKATFGVTPTAFVNTRRIKEAEYTLSISTLSVAEICYSVGFESIPYFIKLFKKEYGITPAKYRKLKKSKADSSIR